jgi:hypothetical protein
VSPGGHSAKNTLPSARSRTLDKVYFKIKKIFAECQITGTLQRGFTYRQLALSSSLSHSHSCTLTAPPPRRRSRPSPSCRVAAARRPCPPPSRARRAHRARPSAVCRTRAPRRAPARRCALHAAVTRRLARDPTLCRIARDPPSRPRPNLEGDLYETIRFNIESYLYTCFG